MRLYRFGFKKYIDDLSGTGGLYRAGRWHHKGTRIVYFSETVSLAKLEVLANATRIPKSYRLLTIEIPDKISVLEINRHKLPEGWNDFPPHSEIKHITEEWIAENKYVFMKVPSVHSPVESNFLLNLQHEDANKIKIISTEPHQFDERLKKASKSISDILSEIWGRGRSFK